MGLTAEELRLDEARDKGIGWRDLGPYLRERQWGTVREDYSDSGDAWDYFTHDQARSRAYRWGEDGLARISDNKQRLYFALAMRQAIAVMMWRRHYYVYDVDRLLGRHRASVALGSRLSGRGLYLDVPAWGRHVFKVTADGRSSATGG